MKNGKVGWCARKTTRTEYHVEDFVSPSDQLGFGSGGTRIGVSPLMF